MIVQGLPEHAKRAGLTDAQIRNAVESRLRGARIFKEDSTSHVNVKFLRGRTGYGKPVLRPLRDFPRVQSTVDCPAFELGLPRTDMVNRHHRQRRCLHRFLGSLGRLVDEFLVEYLRVRDSEACQEFRRQPAQFDRLKSLTD